MRCIAIDDEPIALAIIEEYCNRRGNMQLETYSNPHLGLQRVMEWMPDLVFLDIEMNGVSGIELARSIPKDCCIIFTTAYADYALEGFEVNAIDFLHKPFFYARFEKAVAKAAELTAMRSMMKMSESAERKITLKVEYKNVTVSIDDILYIEAMDNYCKLYRIGKPTIISQISLKSLLAMLPQNLFIRTHRSFAVPVNRIARFTRQQIELTDGTTHIPIGRMYSDDVLRTLSNDLRCRTSYRRE